MKNLLLQSLPIIPESANQLAHQVPPGRLVELSGGPVSARLTTAVRVVEETQRLGETVAWVQLRGGALFPPDLEQSGVDLQSLIVVHVSVQAGSYAIPKAAELLLRSGGFGLVVLDLTGQESHHLAHAAWQGRLMGLAREHNSRVLCLSDTLPQATSLGPLISLRVQAQRLRVAPGLFSIQYQILKNKIGLAGDFAAQRCRAPWGLR